MKEIKHQKQGDKDCVCTCIAMIAGLKRRRIRKLYHDKYMASTDFNTPDILKDLHITYRECSQGEKTQSEKVYLATTPSVNMQGMFHQIIIDTRGGRFKLFDPNQGVTGRNYYVLEVSPKSRKQVRLQAWILEYEIIM